MRLHLRTWGSGSRTALLVHGFSDDATTWWRVAPALAERGFTVVAPDLRGHGASPRGGGYALADLAEDLVESLPRGADLAVGHSLGAVVLALAAPSLAPLRTVLVDPCWLLPLAEVDLTAPLPTRPSELPAETAGWSAEDVSVDLASNALLDPRVAAALLTGLDVLPVTPAASADAVVVVPGLLPLLQLAAHDAVRAAGYAIRTVPGTRHVVHRDDLDGFLDAVLAVDAPVG